MKSIGQWIYYRFGASIVARDFLMLLVLELCLILLEDTGEGIMNDR